MTAPGWLWTTLPSVDGHHSASLRAIIRAAAHAFDVDEADLCGGTCRPSVVAARHIMWASMHMAGYSYPAIGRATGIKDHSTVLAACHRVNGRWYGGNPPRPPEWLEAAERLLEAAREEASKG